MAVLSTNQTVTRVCYSDTQVASGLFCVALVLTVLQYSGLLPSWLHRIPEEWVPPFAVWLDAAFIFIREDLQL